MYMLNLSTTKTVLFTCLMVVFALGCKKDDDDDNQGNNPGTNAPADYSPLTTGSNWTYQSNDGTSYTITVSNKDTVAQSMTYKVLTNNNGPNIYRTKSGTEYHQFLVIPELGTNGFDLLYLKEDQPVNATWQTNQTLSVPNIPLPLAATFKYTIKEKGATRTVSSKPYSDVIHVRLDVSVAGLGSVGGGDFYYAQKIGMIEWALNLSYSGTEVVNQTDLLTAYTIK